MPLRGKVLVARGAIGGSSVRSCKKLPPCLLKPVPASFKMDPPPAKAKPISSPREGLTLEKSVENCLP